MLGVKAAPQTIEIHDVAQLCAARHGLDLYLQRYSLPAQVTYDLLTCVQEAAKNALRFAPGPCGVQISVYVGPSDALVTVRDHGVGLDLGRVSDLPPATSSESRRGLFLLCALMDDVEFCIEDGTEARLHKGLAPEPSPQGHAA